MKKLTDRIRHHNAWRRSKHNEMCDVTQLGRDLELIADEHDKLADQNKMLRDALNEIRDQPLSAPEIDDLIDRVIEQTKC